MKVAIVLRERTHAQLTTIEEPELMPVAFMSAARVTSTVAKQM